MKANVADIEPIERGYFGVYFPSCEATREINTKITLEWAQKRFVIADDKTIVMRSRK